MLDAHEPSGTYHVAIVQASFPRSQTIARPARLTLTVRNLGLRPIPNVAVTVDSFSYASNFRELADPKRPIWVIEQGPGLISKLNVETQEVSTPGSGQTSYVNTWALGPLAPRQTRTFLWRVVPVKAGLHTVRFSFAAGLAGKARARLLGGGLAQGRLTVYVAPKPPVTHVNPNTGEIEVGAIPAQP